MVADQNLLTDDDLHELEAFYAGFTSTGVTRVDCENIQRLLSHIAVQSAEIAALKEERNSWDQDGVVAKLDSANAEIARLRAVPEKLMRYAELDDGYGNFVGIGETDAGKYVEYAELVAAIGGVE